MNTRRAARGAQLRRGLCLGLTAAGISPVAMILLTIFVERRPFVLSDQYVAFVVGDVLIALAVGVAASVPDTPTTRRAPAAVLALVVVGAVAFGGWQLHAEIASGAYTPGQAYSPTKLWHQFVVYPALALLLTASVPRVWGQWSRLALVALLLSGWVAGMWWDQYHTQDPHCDYDWSLGLIGTCKG